MSYVYPPEQASTLEMVKEHAWKVPVAMTETLSTLNPYQRQHHLNLCMAQTAVDVRSYRLQANQLIRPRFMEKTTTRRALPNAQEMLRH